MFVIADLDGTLALIDHRRHFIAQRPKDWTGFFAACDQDLPHTPIIAAVLALDAQPESQIEIWSGRSDEVRDKTEAWLARFGLGHLPLKMRPAGDTTPDDILKRRWLHESPVRPSLVFDDRDKVVAMWRREGIVCAQVALGDF